LDHAPSQSLRLLNRTITLFDAFQTSITIIGDLLTGKLSSISSKQSKAPDVITPTKKLPKHVTTINGNAEGTASFQTPTGHEFCCQIPPRPQCQTPNHSYIHIHSVFTLTPLDKAATQGHQNWLSKPILL
jgi:hypothetical protein